MECFGLASAPKSRQPLLCSTQTNHCSDNSANQRWLGGTVTCLPCYVVILSEPAIDWHIQSSGGKKNRLRDLLLLQEKVSCVWATVELRLYFKPFNYGPDQTGSILSWKVYENPWKYLSNTISSRPLSEWEENWVCFCCNLIEANVAFLCFLLSLPFF